MKLEGDVYCEGPECYGHWHAGLTRFDGEGRLDSLPPGFVRFVWYGDREDETFLFCGPECAMKWCAQQEPPEIISFHDQSEPS